MEEMELAVQAVSTPMVQMWINWMLFIFMASILFVWKHKSARIVLASFILTLPVALLIFNLTKSAHLIGVAHIMIWGPLAYFLFKSDLKEPSFRPKSTYGIWVILLLITIAISLVFDVRDAVLIMFGMK